MTHPNLLEELEQDFTQQKLEAMWRRYAPYVLVGAVLIIVLTASFTAWTRYMTAKHSAATKALIDVVTTKDGDGASAISKLEDYAAHYSGTTQAAFARLHAAALASKDGKQEQALALYNGVAQEPGVDIAFRQLAQLLAIEVQMDSADVSGLRKNIEPLLDSRSPWRAKALEDSGYLALKAGDRDAARKAFAEIAQDVSLPKSMTERAQNLLNAFGN